MPVARNLVGIVLLLVALQPVACFAGGSVRRAPKPLHTVRATTFDPELLTQVQHRTFDYFWDGAHSSGLAWESTSDSGPSREPRLAVGATGMGMMAIIVGIERGFISRAAGAERIARILDYLHDKAPRYHGAWPHWLDPATGEGFGQEGNDSYRKSDIVETGYAVEGLLCARQYFTDPNDPTEAHIRTLADTLWRDVDWAFYAAADHGRLYWHWSVDSGFQCPAQADIYGFNECMIAYLLGMASPTHPLPVSSYEKGWLSERYTTDAEYKGIRHYLQYAYRDGWGMNVCAFWTHYSYLGFDPRTIRDSVLGRAGAPAGFTYFDVFRNIARINREYFLDHHPKDPAGAWGLSASYDPSGYAAHSPVPFAGGMGDNGTITPSAALGSFPYTPDESYEALRAFRADPKLWGRYGFYDAYNPGRNWYVREYIGIDQGPIVIGIENQRTGLLWKLFMSHPDISDPKMGLLRKLADAGWMITPPAR